MDALVYRPADLDNATLSRLGSEGYAIFDPATRGDLLLFVKDAPTPAPPSTVAAPAPTGTDNLAQPDGAMLDAQATAADPTTPGAVDPNALAPAADPSADPTVLPDSGSWVTPTPA